jgi:hypothetical protein
MLSSLNERREPCLSPYNLSQLTMMVANSKDLELSKVIDEKTLIFSFINHLKDYFSKTDQKFLLLEPLLDEELDSEQQTVLSIDGIEVGELLLLTNSFFEGSSLVHYSPSGLIESTLINSTLFHHYKVSDYLLMIHEFASVLLAEKLLYKKINEA